jgi:lipopolysaccharide/colanic/teichoic acid biosynthesis glycosyltransferase
MNRTAKRIFDVVASSAALIALFLPLLVIAVLVRLCLGSPVLFRQMRPGLHGRPFQLVKFRTMTDAADAEGHPLPDAVRLTRFGAFLRSTSLDELPELWNVLKGDMSLVGPRPLLTEYLPLYSTRQSWRHEVKPGLTGWAQVNGRNALTWEDRLEMDVWYVENRSLLLDLKIILMTLGIVLKRSGIRHEGSATMERFKGNSKAGQC